MFPIDKTLLPSLTTRRALIVIDAQNDFLAEEGALPIKIPLDLPERLADLATDFRQSGGDVIWVCSQFDKSRSLQDEQVLTSDRPAQIRSSDIARGRRRHASPQIAQTTECPEAFLTQESPKQPKCVRPGTPGIEMHPTVANAVGPKDYSLVKTYYSAFRSEQLLRLLRMRFVTELFICGCMTNISIMATAVEAASHGYTITIVDDCCGFQSMMRHRCAVKRIADTTGCDVLTAEAVLGSFKPAKPKVASKRPDHRPAVGSGGRLPTVRRAEEEDGTAASPTSKIQSSLENLALSGEPAADKPDLQAPTQDPAQPLQPVVIAKEHEQEKSDQVPETAPSIVKSDATRPEPEPEDVVGSSPTDGDRDAQATSRGSSQLSPLAAQDHSMNALVSHDTSTIAPQPDKEHKAGADPIRPDDDESSSLAKKTNPESKALSDSSNKEPRLISRAADDPQPRREEESIKVSSTEGESNNNRMEPQNIRPSESEPLCEGDTKVIYDVLPAPLSDNVFERIRDEVRWQRMSHQGGEVPRLVAVQGQVDEDGTKPVYRHPADESPPLLPFSPTVQEIRGVIEERLGHPLNHVLIQFYRDGTDYISEHSDKTLDIARGSYIANVSLGAERTMTLRTKRQPKSKTIAAADAGENAEPSPEELKRQVQRAHLPHNSLCQMGLATNMRWLHAIRQDKRLEREKSAAERAYDGGRISLTFRHIGTFLDRDNQRIWGQGARSKSQAGAHEVINGQTDEAVKMLQAFGRENQSTEFDWDECYGAGFDVLHISAAQRLFLSVDPIVNMRIQLMLAEYGISYARGSMSPLFNWKDGKAARDAAAVPEDLPIKFVDNDLAKTTVQGDIAIMMYLDRVYGKARDDDDPSSSSSSPSPSQAALARQFSRFQQGLSLLDKHRASPTLTRELAIWDAYAGEAEFIAGPGLSLADFAVWPVLHDIYQKKHGDDPDPTTVAEKGNNSFENLRMYYERVKSREAVAKFLMRGEAAQARDTNTAATATAGGAGGGATKGDESSKKSPENREEPGDKEESR
ncbi:hypothetical protein F5B20DRAFT_590391 [Whalleya microplaca]|nr:hypothetical protein F5B20DRAFT_590391 [Whalleya microplaca]